MSELRKRFNALRRESGVDGSIKTHAAEPTGTAGASDVPGRSLRDLEQRIRRLTRARPTRSAKTKPSELNLAEILGAEFITPGLLKKTTRLPAEYLHGRDKLEAKRCVRGLSRISGLSVDLASVPLFFDTETTGLAGGTGTAAFLLGTARFRGEHLEVCQFLLTAFGGEAAMYSAFAEQLTEATIVVSFNGRSFDAPLISTRARLCGRADPLGEHPHVDLLHPLRRSYARRWDDCRLVSAERHLFGLSRNGDIPGALLPQVWLDWLHRGEWSRLGQVLHHNWLDLVSLAALAPHLASCQDDPIGHGADPLSVLRGDSAREPATVLAYLEAHRRQLEPRAKLELARLARREGDWNLAIDVWSELADAGQVEATEHLAKYYEHQARDVSRARKLTERLLGLEPCKASHRQRAARLDGRLARLRATADS